MLRDYLSHSQLKMARTESGWCKLPKEVLRYRLDEWMSKSKQVEVTDPIMRRLGCVKSHSVRANGDGQIKMRYEGKQWAPRPWQVAGVIAQVDITALDGSHLCGMGLQGCCNPDHIHWESHDINLSRKPCTQYTTCPCECRMVHAVRPCPGHGDAVPHCLQAAPFRKEL